MPDNKTIVVKSVGLTKIFRDFWNRPKARAVNDIDFEVREGDTRVDPRKYLQPE